MTGSLEAAPARGAGGRRFAAALLLCLAGVAVLCALGVWQVERLAWKNALVARIDSRIHAAPRPLADIEAMARRGEDMDYQPVRLSGRFLHSAERHLLATRDGAAGWDVFTPLISGDGRTIFVNRGFVPYEMKDPARRPEGQGQGTVEITGLARAAPAGKSSAFVPDNDPARNAFFWRSLPDMAAGLRLPAGAALLPFFVDAGPGRAPGGYPIGGATIVDLPNDHLQYAVTWFGLAAALLVMTALLVLRRLRGRRAVSPAAPKT